MAQSPAPPRSLQATSEDSTLASADSQRSVGGSRLRQRPSASPKPTFAWTTEASNAYPASPIKCVPAGIILYMSRPITLYFQHLLSDQDPGRASKLRNKLFEVTIAFFFIVSHFTTHFPRHKPPNNSRPMRLNGVLVATILVLVASVNFVRAASDATVVKLPKVMNSADAHEVMGNNRRLLKTHKPANTEKGEEERGFADVVIEAMTKQKVDKVLADLENSMAAFEKVKDIKVLDKLHDAIDPAVLYPT
ncbi:unnamed protein product [Phytophthora lilii]|uniref:RxLR effector protein n=1 Tax=Phytophthora lilii TaxID=2077276 RepID=A0A9W6WR89_9STRA|nr:unnamed protein product [Phytophthora lilii]